MLNRSSLLVFYCLGLLYGRLALAQDTMLEYVDEPFNEWQRSVGTSQTVDGNALVLSPDETVLYVTTSDGTLYALEPSAGKLLETIRPKLNDRNWTITCNSGISFGKTSNYLIYAITDNPPDNDYVSRKESRIVAVDHNFLRTRWISESFDGEIAGKPVVSSDGQYIFFTRNSLPREAPPTQPPTKSPTTSPTASPVYTFPPTPAKTVAPEPDATSSPTSAPVTSEDAGVDETNAPTAPDSPTTSPTEAPTEDDETTDDGGRLLQESGVVGYFTILSSSGGDVFHEEASTDLIVSNQYYGPVGIARDVKRGMYKDGESNTNDVIVWHSSSGDTPRDGETQLFQFPVNSTTKVETLQLGSASWTTEAAPVLSSSGEELFFGSSEGVIRGWVNDRPFDRTPNFNVKLDGAKAPPDAAVLSVNEKVLFISTSKESFFAVDIPGEKVLWKANQKTEFNISTKAVVSPDGLRVYYPTNNRLHSKAVRNGTDYWETPYPNEDESEIVADFTISSDGRHLYYVGHRKNYVTALQVARFPGETEAPSAKPSPEPTVSPAPVSPPSDQPSMRPSQVPVQPPGEPSNDSINAAMVGAIIGGVVGVALLGGLGWYFFKIRQERSDIESNYNASSAREPEPERPASRSHAKPKRYSYDPTSI